ncbi:MAG TPA: aminodeoxychorismate/anthranilate synthase component II [Clostridiales bacterium]|nr:aminodeoxychorismate/anthranilate synthase component II [Clostridiales bacterium]
MILLIDNFDSFTYNVYQMVGEINPDIQVFRNDALTPADIRRLKPERIIFSPGPGYPASAGQMPAIIRELHREVPMLGICLGHQALAEAFGGVISEASQPVHGKRSPVHLDTDCPLFRGLPAEIIAGRYHSLVVNRASLPSCFKITATSPDGQIMGIQHRELPLFGLQFHPESILTTHGTEMLQAFLAI